MRKILCALLVFLLLTCAAYAEGTEWTYDTNNGCLNQYLGAGGDVAVPAEADGYEFVFTGLSLFENGESITSLTFPDTLLSLGESNINTMPNLASLSVPDSLQIIGPYNYYDCDLLTEVVVPSAVCFVGGDCFSWCENLSSITFTGACPIFARPDSCFSVLADGFVIYVPDDQLDAYKAALPVAAEHIQPSGANAVYVDYAAPESDFAFDPETGAITAYLGNAARIDIPQTIGGAPVTAIGEGAFKNVPANYVTIPEGVTRVEASAFMNAYELHVIIMPDSLISIGDDAFYNAGGNVIRWGEGLETIGARAFRYNRCSGMLNLPESLVSIGEAAFENAWFREAHLGSRVESIGARAFAGGSLNYLMLDQYDMIDIAPGAFADTNLRDVDLPWESTYENRQAYKAVFAAQAPDCYVWINNPADCEYTADDATEYAYNEDGTCVVSAYTGTQPNVMCYHIAIGDSMDYDIVGVGDGAFRGNQTLEKFRVTRSDHFTTIGAEAFADSSMSVIDLYHTTQTIGAGAFRNCANAKELTLPASVTSIGDGAFDGMAGLTALTIECDPACLPEGAFRDCAALETVSIARGAIPDGLFETQKITSLTLGADVTEIGARAFAAAPLTELNLDQFAFVGEDAFASARVSSLVLPANADVDPSIAKIVPEDGLRLSADATDEQLAAWNEKLNRPRRNPLLRVGEESSFALMTQTPEPAENFEFDPETGTLLRYTGRSVDLVIPKSIGGVDVKIIAYGLLDDVRGHFETEENTDDLPLRSVVIPETIEVIEDSAFSCCRSLETVVCYASLETTGRGVFAYCPKLTTVVFVNGVGALDNYAFDQCESLETVWYGENTLDMIGVQCFGFTGLTAFVADAKRIDDSAFRDCAKLTEIHIRNAETILTNAFYGCTSLYDICLESAGAAFDMEWSSSGECAPGATLTLPEDVSDEYAKTAYDAWSAFNFGPIADETHVARKACAYISPAMPDYAAILASYAGNPIELPEPTPEPEPQTAAPVGEAGAPFVGVWIGDRMVVDGETYDLASLGMDMRVTLNADGTCAMVDAEGAEDEAVWTAENGAARIDGCSDFGIMLRIVLPLSTPVMAILALYYGLAHWNDYFTALIYINSRQYQPLQIFLREILIQNAQFEMGTGDVMALEDSVARVYMLQVMRYGLIVVSSVPMLLLYPFVQKYFVQGVMIGALKG